MTTKLAPVLVIGGGLLGLFLLRRAAAPSVPTERLQVVEASFVGDSFEPGTGFTLVLTFKNTGTKTAVLSGGKIYIFPDVGTFALPDVSISPGLTSTYTRPITVPSNALPGAIQTWKVVQPYDGKTLEQAGTAFTIGVPLAAKLEIIEIRFV